MCVHIYIYILSTCIYTHICPYRHLGVRPYAHTVGKCFTSVHLCLALCYRIGTQSNTYSENKLRLNFNARFSEINRIFSPGIRPPLIFSMHCAFVPYRFYVFFFLFECKNSLKTSATCCYLGLLFSSWEWEKKWSQCHCLSLSSQSLNCDRIET